VVDRWGIPASSVIQGRPVQPVRPALPAALVLWERQGQLEELDPVGPQDRRDQQAVQDPRDL